MNKSRFLIETHLRTGKSIGELARAHGVHRSWLYRLLRRFKLEGDAGLEPRSRRPHRSPARISHHHEDEIIELRKSLVDSGFDAGAATIHEHLLRRLPDAPSISTIHRVLRARGFVAPQPKKRPKSSYVRFQADFPNECWQADITHWVLADGTSFEILNVIDDHSRLCVASRAFMTVRSPDVIRTLHKAAAVWGYPAAFLTDNGTVFTAGRVGGSSAFEAELISLGIRAKHSRPYHPQTCGKVERFHQTLKRFLAAKKDVRTKKQFQRALDLFSASYNGQRPHRSLGRKTPLEVFSSREKVTPSQPMIDTTGYRVRQDKVDKWGRVTLRHKGKLHHIGIGNPYAGWRVVILVSGLEIRIVGLDGSPLRHFTLDPTKDYQPIP